MTDAAGGGNAPGGAPPRRFLLEISLIAGIVALDQLTKLLVRAWIPVHGSVTVVPFDVHVDDPQATIQESATRESKSTTTL